MLHAAWSTTGSFPNTGRPSRRSKLLLENTATGCVGARGLRPRDLKILADQVKSTADDAEIN